jgi:hypothetical protein
MYRNMLQHQYMWSPFALATDAESITTLWEQFNDMDVRLYGKWYEDAIIIHKEMTASYNKRPSSAEYLHPAFICLLSVNPYCPTSIATAETSMLLRLLDGRNAETSVLLSMSRSDDSSKTLVAEYAVGLNATRTGLIYTLEKCY